MIDITHDATERNKSSSPNTPSTERTNAPPIDRTNRPINRGITGVGEETHVYATGNDSELQLLIPLWHLEILLSSMHLLFHKVVECKF
jgi:hypothetical protein